MLVSAVLDPSAFDSDYFDELYRIHAEDLLKGIERNGLLIVDLDNILEDELTERVYSVPTEYGQHLQIYLEELLKNRNRRIVEWPVSTNDASSGNLLDLAYHLKRDTQADALVVGDESLETLKSEQKYGTDIVPLSEYRYSGFEKDRQRYEIQGVSIDKLPEAEIEDIIIRSVRFTKWLRFYDPYIGRGGNTRAFRKGIEYILSLWYQHGFFASHQGVGSVEIFTCSAQHVHVHDQHRRITQGLIEPLTRRFPLPINVSIKEDPNRIFHARYLETQQAIIRVDRGFDIFNRNGGFRTNFFTLNMAESSHLKECRNLPNATL